MPRNVDFPSAHPSVALPSEADWYRTEELAQLLKVDPSTVRRWRTARPPQGPPFVKLSERITLYSAADVHQWLADHRVDPRQAG